jgi:hypothetical protein
MRKPFHRRWSPACPPPQLDAATPAATPTRYIASRMALPCGLPLFPHPAVESPKAIHGRDRYAQLAARARVRTWHGAETSAAQQLRQLSIGMPACGASPGGLAARRSWGQGVVTRGRRYEWRPAALRLPCRLALAVAERTDCTAHAPGACTREDKPSRLAGGGPTTCTLSRRRTRSETFATLPLEGLQVSILGDALEPVSQGSLLVGRSSGLTGVGQDGKLAGQSNRLHRTYAPPQLASVRDAGAAAAPSSGHGRLAAKATKTAQSPGGRPHESQERGSVLTKPSI